MNAVDRELSASLTTLQTLATARSLERGDLAMFQEDARRVLARQRSWMTITLFAPTGRRAMDLATPASTALTDPVEPESFQTVLRTARPAIGRITVRLKDQMSRIAEQHATAIEELQSTNEELETTNEELQSTNEELETTNEELQSTNEELETTNEELQSTNEELETTVEELQAANTELATLNSELESRTGDLNRLDAFHRSLINGLELGLAVLNCDGVVVTWNQVAEGMWGLRAEQALHRPFTALPVGEVVPRAHAVLERVLSTGEAGEVVDVPYAMPGGSARRGTLRMVPLRDGTGEVTGVLAVMRAGAGRG